MLTLYLFIVIKDERYFKFKGTIFLVVIVVRKIPVFFLRGKWTHLAVTVNSYSSLEIIRGKFLCH